VFVALESVVDEGGGPFEIAFGDGAASLEVDDRRRIDARVAFEIGHDLTDFDGAAAIDQLVHQPQLDRRFLGELLDGLLKDVDGLFRLPGGVEDLRQQQERELFLRLPFAFFEQHLAGVVEFPLSRQIADLQREKQSIGRKAAAALGEDFRRLLTLAVLLQPS